MRDLLESLKARHLRVAIAEGDTGGLLLERLTAEPGSSAVVLGGVVAYHDALKRGLLGVSEDVLREHGAVSAEAAEAMARGVRQVTGAELGVATTGIAGPGGATPLKPVGLAYVAIAMDAGIMIRAFRWRGDRAANRHASAEAALLLLGEALEKTTST